MKKYIIIFLVSFLIPLNTFSIKYTINNTNIYISENYIDINKNDILIIDDRQHSDIMIINSYKIDSVNTQDKIIDLILDYNKKYPNKNWIRTKNSMKTEWFIHNILYKFGIYKNRTRSVDFETNEENLYKLLSIYLQI